MNKLIEDLKTDENPHNCVRCKVVWEGMEKYDLGAHISGFQHLYNKILNIEILDESKKYDMVEIIASIMKQLGQTGKIERVILKLFDKQMTEFLSEFEEVLDSWRALRNCL